MNTLAYTIRLLHNQGLSYLNYASDDHLMLHESLTNCDWSCVCKHMSVDLAVESLNTAVNDATTQAMPVSYHRTNFCVSNLVH
jgi:aminoglycoside N3'-acetyltransferase